MSFIGEYNFSPIETYAQAKQRWEDIVPIRGRSVDTRPLEGRNSNARIAMDGMDVLCYLHNTSLVRYKPNGDIEVDLHGWSTPTTYAFVGQVVGNAIYSRSNRCWMLGYPDVPLGDGVNKLKLSTDTGRLELLNPVYHKSYHVRSRKISNAVMAEYKGFNTWLKGRCKLEANEEGGILTGRRSGALQDIKALVRGCKGKVDADKYTKMYTFLAEQTGTSRFDYDRMVYEYLTTQPRMTTEFRMWVYAANHKRVLHKVPVLRPEEGADKYAVYVETISS